MRKKNTKPESDPAVDVQRVVRTRHRESKCKHNMPMIYTTFNVSKDQYEWHCTKCQETIKIVTRLAMLTGF